MEGNGGLPRGFSPTFPNIGSIASPLGGGGSILIRKPRAFAEIYNDIDSEIVNVFRVIQTYCPELRRRLEATPFARQEFDLAHESTADPIERARRSIVRSFMGHGADSLTRGYKSGFRSNTNSEGQGRNAAQDWINYMPALESFRERLMGVVIENKDAIEIMRIHDSKRTLHYVDPPYLHSVRSSSRWGKHGYRFELSQADHEQLCEVLAGLKGMVILSGYANETYERLGWIRHDTEARADGGLARTESLWLNSAANKLQPQAELPF